MAEILESFNADGTVEATVVGKHRRCTIAPACGTTHGARPASQHPGQPTRGYVVVTQNAKLSQGHKPGCGRRYVWEPTYEAACTYALGWANRRAR